MRPRILLLAALVAAALLSAAGCGGVATTGATTTLGGAASLAPADAAAFVAVDTTLSSGQWSALDDLLQTFPSRDALLAELRQRLLQETGLAWETDVRPALGDELDLVRLAGTEERWVGLTQPHDQAKLDALLKKEKLVSRPIGGWTAFAETAGALDALESATAKLDSSTSYRAATAKLAADALVHAYANGGSTFDWAAADVRAESGGLRSDAWIHGAPGATAPHASQLVDRIPGDALVVVDLTVPSGGLTLPAKLDVPQGVLGGESALYVRPGALMVPEVTLVTQPVDLQKAVAALPQRIGGLSLVHATVGDLLVASTSQKGIDDFRSSGSKLADAAAFKDASSSAGMPDQTTGFLYANLKDALPLAQVVAPMLGVQLPNVDLSALRSLAAYGTRSGDEQHFGLFLQVG